MIDTSSGHRIWWFRLLFRMRAGSFRYVHVYFVSHQRCGRRGCAALFAFDLCGGFAKPPAYVSGFLGAWQTSGAKHCTGKRANVVLFCVFFKCPHAWSCAQQIAVRLCRGDIRENLRDLKASEETLSHPVSVQIKKLLTGSGSSGQSDRHNVSLFGAGFSWAIKQQHHREARTTNQQTPSF